jgi:hypothetical protein
LDSSTLCLFLTTQLEAKQTSETRKQRNRSHVERTACIA